MEITQDEMTARWKPDATTEYGEALHFAGPEELDPAMAGLAKKLVIRNFQATGMQHPEYGLGDFCYIIGPKEPAWEYADCPACDGQGHLEGDNRKECRDCEGAGRVPVRIIPGLFVHCFSWYAVVPRSNCDGC